MKGPSWKTFHFDYLDPFLAKTIFVVWRIPGSRKLLSSFHYTVVDFQRDRVARGVFCVHDLSEQTSTVDAARSLLLRHLIRPHYVHLEAVTGALFARSQESIVAATKVHFLSFLLHR